MEVATRGLDDPADVARRSYPSPMHACRRDELERLLKFNNIELNGYMTKDAMLPMALELQLSGEMKVPTDGWRPGHKEAQALVKPEDDLNKVGFLDLRKLCKERDIEIAMTDTKAILLEKLNGGVASDGG